MGGLKISFSQSEGFAIFAWVSLLRWYLRTITGDSGVDFDKSYSGCYLEGDREGNGNNFSVHISD